MPICLGPGHRVVRSWRVVSSAGQLRTEHLQKHFGGASHNSGHAPHTLQWKALEQGEPSRAQCLTHTLLPWVVLLL